MRTGSPALVRTGDGRVLVLVSFSGSGRLPAQAGEILAVQYFTTRKYASLALTTHLTHDALARSTKTS